jgi:hypothetical protein
MTDETKHIQTHGGAAIAGNANVGGDFVNRDKLIFNFY